LEYDLPGVNENPLEHDLPGVNENSLEYDLIGVNDDPSEYDLPGKTNIQRYLLFVTQRNLLILISYF
jgi:hypothetical protein